MQIPEGVLTMVSTFTRCYNLNQAIKIPNTVTTLGSDDSRPGTFEYCNNLNQNIVIPENVTSITRLFSHCTNLNQDIYMYSDKIQFE